MLCIIYKNIKSLGCAPEANTILQATILQYKIKNSDETWNEISKHDEVSKNNETESKKVSGNDGHVIK